MRYQGIEHNTEAVKNTAQYRIKFYRYDVSFPETYDPVTSTHMKLRERVMRDKKK